MEILFLYRDYVISVLRYRYTYSTSQKGSTNKRRERTEHTFIISDMAHLFGDESLPCQHKFIQGGRGRGVIVAVLFTYNFIHLGVVQSQRAYRRPLHWG